MKNAFLGTKHLYGEKFDKIQKAHFLIIGIGGVGSWIAEYLVRAGALNITLVDLDEICVTNINRQIHSHERNIGQSKIDEMKKRLLQINSAANINLIHDFLSASTIDEIFSQKYDFVFDAIDGIKNKCLIIQKCKREKIPFIVTGAAGARFNPTLIKIADLNRTINDKLLFRVKKKLKKDYGYSKNSKRSYRIPVVFSTEVPIKSSLANCELQNNTVSNCESGLGSAGFVTSAFASSAVFYALEKL